MDTGQTQAHVSSCTASSSPKSESNEFVALPFCSSWFLRISRSTQARPKLLCLQARQALVQSQRASRLAILPIMVSQDQSKHTGHTQAPLSSCTSSPSPNSESNEFVALPFCSSWSHRISGSTQARPELLFLHARQAVVQSQRAMNLSLCHFARHGLTGSVEARRSDPSSFVFRHLKL